MGNIKNSDSNPEKVSPWLDGLVQKETKKWTPRSSRGETGDARYVAGEVIWRVVREQAYASLVLDSVLDTVADKAFCNELVYGTLRWYNPILHSIKRALDKPNKKIDARIVPHLAIAAYQLQYLSDRVPAHAAVNAAVNAVRKVRAPMAGFANALLRRLGSPPKDMLGEGENDVHALASAFGVPETIVEAMKVQLPSNELQGAVAACNDRPSLWIRFFGDATQEKQWVNDVKQAGFEIHKHPFVPLAWAIEKPGAVKELPGFSDGSFMVQDPGSQLAALLVHACEGEFVIDLCAAPGTKTMVLAHNVGKSGRVVAYDINARKVSLIEENAHRMKLKVDARVGDAGSVEVYREWVGKADHVLLDAPCSSVGTLRRHPELKLRFENPSPQPSPRDAGRGGIMDNSSVVTAQRNLLEAASKLVKVGGSIVYSVCSPMPQEGLEIVRDFVRDSNFSIVSAREVLPWLPENAVDDYGAVHVWPHAHACDAFYCAKLVRRK